MRPPLTSTSKTLEGTIVTVADLLEIAEIIGKNRVGNKPLKIITMEEKSFEEWYDAFREFVNVGGYNGPIDEDTFRAEYEEGKDAYDAAQEFLAETIE